MRLKDYWAATPLRTTPEGDEPQEDTAPDVPDAEPRE